MSLDLELPDAPAIQLPNLQHEYMNNNISFFNLYRPCLTLDSVLERQSFTFNTVHNFWALLTLKVDQKQQQQQQLSAFCSNVNALFVDFVVIIDISASMTLESKLTYVKATIQYMLTKLDERHRFSLIVFNHNVQTLCENLVMNSVNKQHVLKLLEPLEPTGSTNMADALIRGIEILQRRPHNETNRPSSIMFFTDGLSNRCTSGRSILEVLQEVNIPQGCIINTFGYGEDHDSKLLRTIAVRAQVI